MEAGSTSDSTTISTCFTSLSARVSSVTSVPLGARISPPVPNSVRGSRFMYAGYW